MIFWSLGELVSLGLLAAVLGLSFAAWLCAWPGLVLHRLAGSLARGVLGLVLAVFFGQAALRLALE